MEITVVSLKGEPIKFITKTPDPYYPETSNDVVILPIVGKLTSAVVILGVILGICGLSCVAYFLQKRYLLNEGRIKKKLANTELKASELDRCIKRIKEIRFTEEENKYN